MALRCLDYALRGSLASEIIGMRGASSQGVSDNGEDQVPAHDSVPAHMNAVGVNQKLAPIAVFAYNRPDKLAALMNSLQACHGFEDSDITIFVDGPKGDGDRAAVEAVQASVRGLRLPNVAWTFQEANHGLRNSIFAGVSEIVGAHGKVIVLEDDLVLSPVALNYFNEALDYYADAQRVWSIVGYVYDAPTLRNSPDTMALPFTHPWGWATWSRAWNQFSLDDRPDPESLSAKSFRTAFDMDGLYPFTAQLKNSIEGRVNSWFIRWYYTVFKHGGVSIFPPRRLVDNYGLRSGSHGGRLNPHERLVKRPPLLNTLPKFCDPYDVRYAALDSLRQCRELRVQRFIADTGSAKRKVKAFYGRASD